MAKVRVYELAKDLNMTNRAFLNKMKELKIDVKSHMSSLEDSAVNAIKKSLLGKDKKKTDVKVKPSVIRRRRQKVEEIVAPEVEAETAEKVEEKPEKTVVVKKKASAQKEIKVTPSDDEPGAVKEESKEQEIKKTTKKAEPAPKKKKSKPKVKKSKSAKIIKTAESVKPKTIEPEKTKSEPEIDKIEIPPADKKLVKTQTQTETPVEKEETVQEIEPVITEEKEKKPKKKKKKSAPAKIVKIADPLVLENLKKPKPGKDKKRVDTRSEAKGRAKKKPFKKKEHVPSSAPVKPKMGVPKVDITMPGEIDTGKRKKEKRKVDFGDDKPVGKRKQRKRKSVIEGDALYKGGRSRKKRG